MRKMLDTDGDLDTDFRFIRHKPTAGEGATFTNHFVIDSSFFYVSYPKCLLFSVCPNAGMRTGGRSWGAGQTIALGLLFARNQYQQSPAARGINPRVHRPTARR